MAQQMGSGPLAVLSEESQRSEGADARNTNFAASRAVADAIRTTLGPRGMDKMLLDDAGNVIVTNDGVTLLEEMDIEHPAAEMLVEVAATQEEEVGDGTTSAVVLAGELLSVAEDLIEDGVHPTTIVSGYRRAVSAANGALDDLEIEVGEDDVERLERIAATAMTGKTVGESRTHLAALVVEAVRIALSENGIDRDAIDVRTFPGRTVGDSRLVQGALVDKEPPHDGMPRTLSEADVLVYEAGIEVAELANDAEATVSDFADASAFVEREHTEIDRAVERVLDAEADVVLAEGAIDDRAQSRFAEEGVLALRRVDDDDRARVAAATGANPVGTLEDISASDLGSAGEVEQERIREYVHTMDAPHEETFVFSAGTDEHATLLLRGGTSHVLDELERAVEDSIGVVTAAIEDGSVLPGGGAPAVAASLAVADTAGGVEGRQQLAVEAFADALDVLPRTLVRNAGHDAIDALVELRARHDAGERTVGFDAVSGEPVDSLDAGVIEPRRVTETAIETAVEAATMVLRIDDIVSAGELSTAGDDA